MKRMKRPDFATAIRVYYENTEIGNAQIRELFGNISSSTISRLKKQARQLMVSEGEVYTWHANNVNTKLAYKAWGLDIEEIEKRYKKLLSLGMYRPPSDSEVEEVSV